MADPMSRPSAREVAADSACIGELRSRGQSRRSRVHGLSTLCASSATLRPGRSSVKDTWVHEEGLRVSGMTCSSRGWPGFARLSRASGRLAGWMCTVVLCLGHVPGARADQSELEIVETFRHYPISAADAGALHAALSQQRPDELELAGSHALTEIALNSRLELEPREGGGCDWHGPRMVLEMRTSLPQWVDQSASPVWLQSRWNDVLRGLETHEEGHRRLAREQAIRLLEQIRALDRSEFEGLPCRDIERRIGSLKSRALSRLALRQHSYDERTKLGATQGAVLVLGHGQICPRSAMRARPGCDEQSPPGCTCPEQGRDLPGKSTPLPTLY